MSLEKSRRESLTISSSGDSSSGDYSNNGSGNGNNNYNNNNNSDNGKDDDPYSNTFLTPLLPGLSSPSLPPSTPPLPPSSPSSLLTSSPSSSSTPSRSPGSCDESPQTRGGGQVFNEISLLLSSDSPPIPHVSFDSSPPVFLLSGQSTPSLSPYLLPVDALLPSITQIPPLVSPSSRTSFTKDGEIEEINKNSIINELSQSSSVSLSNIVSGSSPSHQILALTPTSSSPSSSPSPLHSPTPPSLIHSSPFSTPLKSSPPSCHHCHSPSFPPSYSKSPSLLSSSIIPNSAATQTAATNTTTATNTIANIDSTSVSITTPATSIAPTASGSASAFIPSKSFPPKLFVTSPLHPISAALTAPHSRQAAHSFYSTSSVASQMSYVSPTVSPPPISLPSNSISASTSVRLPVSISTAAISPSPQLNWGALLLSWLNIFVDSFLSTVLVPVLPKELGLDEIHEGVLFSVGSISAVFLGPICGLLSDFYGWRAAVVWFYPLSFIGTGILRIAGDRFWLYVLSRLVAGAGTCFMYSSTLSMVVGVHHETLQTTAVGVTLSGDFGSLAGPLLGGILYDIGGAKVLFDWMIGLCLFNTLIFLLFHQRLIDYRDDGIDEGVCDQINSKSLRGDETCLKEMSYRRGEFKRNVLDEEVARDEQWSIKDEHNGRNLRMKGGGVVSNSNRIIVRESKVVSGVTQTLTTPLLNICEGGLFSRSGEYFNISKEDGIEISDRLHHRNSDSINISCYKLGEVKVDNKHPKNRRKSLSLFGNSQNANKVIDYNKPLEQEQYAREIVTNVLSGVKRLKSSVTGTSSSKVEEKSNEIIVSNEFATHSRENSGRTNGSCSDGLIYLNYHPAPEFSEYTSMSIPRSRSNSLTPSFHRSHTAERLLENVTLIRNTWRGKFSEFSVFAEFHFVINCLSLFFGWGAGIGLQALLPVVWHITWNVSPTNIGLYFAPYLFLRILSSAITPYTSKQYSIPLHSLITCGLCLSTLCTLALSLLINHPPYIHCSVLSLLGVGIGMMDSCAAAWTIQYVKHSLPFESSITGSFQGRALGVMSQAVDLGTLTIPVVATGLSQYISTPLSLGVCSGLGICISGASVYSAIIYNRTSREFEA